MLAVQIDPTFISLNLYENNQLAFSRFASIDPVDYDNSEDYIYEAVNENIFRMFQFQKTRDASNPIQNVVFYGETSEYIRLTNSLESMDITTSLLGVPNNIGGYENFEFQSYANAIGAMFRSNKESERVNLLETDATVGKAEVGSSFAFGVLAAAGVSAAVIAIICIAIGIGINNTQKKIDDINAYIESEETQNQLAAVDEAQEKIEKIGGFKSGILAAKENYDTLPMLTSEQYQTVAAVFEEAGCTKLEFAYEDGQYQFTGYCSDPSIPALTTQYFYELDMFDNIEYTGYAEDSSNQTSFGGDAEEDTEATYIFELSGFIRSAAVEDSLENREVVSEDETLEDLTEGGEG
jgi:type IV pilus assembly protein PilM